MLWTEIIAECCGQNKYDESKYLTWDKLPENKMSLMHVTTLFIPSRSLSKLKNVWIESGEMRNLGQYMIN